MKTYHCTDVKSYCCEIERQHAEKVETVTQTIDVSAENLLSITTSYLCLKKRDLIKTNISPLPNLNILVVSYISSSQR